MPASNSSKVTREPPPSLPHQSLATAEPHPCAKPDTASPIDSSFNNLSETDTLGCSSPELPPLSAPPRLAFTPRTPQPERAEPEGEYYTASWGSPYDVSLPPAGRHSSLENLRSLSSALNSDHIEEDSPQQSFGLSHLIPSRLTVAYDVTPTRPSTPTGWSPSRDTPRNSIYASSAQSTSQVPARNLLSSFSKFQALENRVQEDVASEFLAASDSKDGNLKSAQQHGRGRGHKSRFSNRTLRQEDILPSNPLTTKPANMESSKYANPLRVPPEALHLSEDPMGTGGQPVPPTAATITSPPSLLERISSAVSVPGTRSRKRLAYKGKACWVTLPNDSSRGEPGQAPVPLSNQELADRLRAFESQGYNTRGFGHWNGVEQSYGSPVYAQNRPVYPDPSDHIQAQRERRFVVKVPNNAHWQAYVKELKEAKLRALGVSLGGEPEESPLSRQTSSQFSGMPFSPPIPTSSAGSQRIGPAGNAFPIGFVPGSSNHTSTRSIASPLSSLGNPRQSMHMHRQSMFTSPPMLPQQAISPQAFSPWSPQSFPIQNMPLSAGSPGISSGAPDMRSPISPFNPVADGSMGFQFPHGADLVAQLQTQKQQQLNRQQQLLAIRPASALPEVPEDDSEEEKPPVHPRSVPPEMFNPRPGHRHNISAKLEESLSKGGFNFDRAHGPTLQKFEDSAQSPVETTPVAKPAEVVPVEKPVPEWRRKAGVASTEASSEKATETTNVPMPQEKPKGITGRTYGLDYSDTETNLSDADFSPDNSKLDSSVISNPWESDPTFQRKQSTSDSKHDKKHSSKLSVSGLNVTAREFNPSANTAASFNPAIFSASAFTFHPEKVKPFVPRSSTQSTPDILALSTGSLGTPSKTYFNLNAPEFNPSGFGGSELSKSEFSFASKGPVLKPTAPSFEPGATSLVSSPGLGNNDSDSSSRLFSSFNLADFADKDAKSANKSKAIPIVAPISRTDGDRDTIFDLSGRPAPAQSKRTRRTNDDDGDNAPLFAMPDPIPLPEDWLKDMGAKTPQSAGDSPKSPGTPDEDSSIRNQDVEVVVEIDSEPASPTPVQEVRVETIEPALLSKSTLQPQQEPYPARSSSLHSHDEDTPRPASPPLQDEDGSISPILPSSPVVTHTNMDDSTQLTPKSISEDDDKLGDTSGQLMSPPSSAIASRPGAELDYSTSQAEGQMPSSVSHKLPSSVRYYDDLEQPTFQEIDAVMQHFHDGGSDFGIEKAVQSWPETSPAEPPTAQIAARIHLPAHVGSDAPSPSPRRGLLNVRQQDLDSASATQDPFSDGRAAIGYESPVHRLNERERVPVSDWDGFSSGDEERIRARGPFLDHHVSELITSVLGNRLGPLEKQIQAIQTAMTGLSPQRASGRVQSRATVDSDADDEDDEFETDFNSGVRAWSRSPMRVRKMERMRSMMQDVLANHRQSLEPAAMNVSVQEAIEDMKTAMTAEVAKAIQPADITNAIETALAQRNFEKELGAIPRLDDIRAAIETSIASHPLTTDSSRTLEGGESTVLSELLQKNVEAIERAAQEGEARKSAEIRAIESEKLLRLAEEELELLRISGKDDGQQLHAIEEKTRAADLRVAQTESVNADLQAKVMSLSESNNALNATLKEYRISHDKWRDDIDTLNREKDKLTTACVTIKLQAEEAVRIRETMRERLEKLQVDTAFATGKLADERSKWQRADAEYRTRYELLRSQAQAEARTRERLEKEMDRLEIQERENMKLRALLDHVQHEKSRLQGDVDSLLLKEREALKMTIDIEHLRKENTKLEEMNDNLRNKSSEHEKAAEKYAREYREARETAHTEVQRTRVLLQADIEAANNHANIIRAGFEDEISRLRSNLESVNMELDTAKEREELIIEQEADSKRDAIREVIEGKTTALAEQREAYEERLEELRRQHRSHLDHVIENKNQSETFVKEAHGLRLEEIEQQSQRALEQAYEDRERSEAYLGDQLSMANAKVELLEDKIEHLQQKLEITKHAAQAAAQAAQSAKSPVAIQSMPTMPSMVGSLGGAGSQALRESVAVLQDQLQERESRIEALEQQLDKFDDSLPEKLKARDTEIGWLRELLGVRVDDLLELVNLLGRDDFDRDSVRNAAIRIRTGLQMDIHEREQQSGNGNNGALSAVPTNLATSIQNYASPKAAQLARVIGEWRSTTPVQKRHSSPQSSSFLSGLMTPPASNVRHTPEPPNTAELRRGSATSSGSQPAQYYASSSSSTRGQSARQQQHGKSRAADSFLHERPRTPQLLQRGAYDSDAEEAGRYSASGFYDDEDSTVEGTPRRHMDRSRNL